MALSLKDGTFRNIHQYPGRVLIKHRIIHPLLRQRQQRGNQGILTAFAASCVMIVLVTYFETSRMLIPSRVISRSDLHQLTYGFSNDVPKGIHPRDNIPHHLTPHPHRPNALMIGFSHCSGHLVANALGSYPGVVVNKKTPKFFTGNHSLRWYLSQMPPSMDHQVTVDVGFSYVTNRMHLKRIHKYNETIKLIVVICNPISRLLANQSDFLRTSKKLKSDSVDSNMLIQSAKTFAHTELGGKKRLDDKHLNMIGDYFKFLVDLFLLFPRKNVLVVERNRLYKNPISEWNTIFKFLGIPHYKQHTSFDSSSKEFCFKASSSKRSCVKDQYYDVSHIFKEAEATGFLESLKEYFRPINKRLFLYLEDNFEW